MPELKAVVADLEQVPEALREFYSEQDGVHRLNVSATQGWELADTTNLKNSLSAERTAREKAESKLNQFEGIDPKKARSALQRVEKLADIDPEKEADRIAQEKFEAMKEQLVEHHTAEVEGLNAKLSKTTSQLEGQMIEAAATKAITDAKGSPALLLPIVKGRTKMRELDDGQFVVDVFTEQGKQAMDSQGNAWSISDLVSDLKASEQFGRAFDGTGRTGGGTPPNGGGGDLPAHTKKVSDMSREERVAFTREHGHEEFEKRLASERSATKTQPAPTV